MIAYRPRYKAVSVTGWVINQSQSHVARSSSKSTPTVFWYVLDRADCHRIVAYFDWYGSDKQGRAERRAAELNAEDEARLEGLT